jgi:hypothetical protein
MKAEKRTVINLSPPSSTPVNCATSSTPTPSEDIAGSSTSVELPLTAATGEPFTANYLVHDLVDSCDSIFDAVSSSFH